VSKPDKSSIPPEKLNHPLLKEAEDRLREQANDKSQRTCTCIHEAAHLTYGRRAGAINYTLFGPAILYDAPTDSFRGSMGMLRLIFPERRPKERTDKAVARVFVAGFLAECYMAACGNALSGQWDFEDFKNSFQGYWNEEELLQNWERAKTEVKEDLRSQTFRAEIRSLAEELEKELFG
jgi:hypothetical protein